MSEVENTVPSKVYPDSTFKFPSFLVNFSNASAYPPWKPVDTKKETTQVFKFGFYTTVGAYAWLYLWKRTTFKIGLPATVIAFATTATAAKGMITNLRETNDGWNTFWAVGAGNLVCLSAGFKSMPAKNKILTGLSGAAITAIIDHAYWAQSTSFAGRDAKYVGANTDDNLEKQQFWDIWKRRPLSQTVEELGVGRGILKP